MPPLLIKVFCKEKHFVFFGFFSPSNDEKSGHQGKISKNLIFLLAIGIFVCRKTFLEKGSPLKNTLFGSIEKGMCYRKFWKDFVSLVPVFF